MAGSTRSSPHRSVSLRAAATVVAACVVVIGCATLGVVLALPLDVRSVRGVDDMAASDVVSIARAPASDGETPATASPSVTDPSVADAGVADDGGTMATATTDDTTDAGSGAPKPSASSDGYEALASVFANERVVDDRLEDEGPEPLAEECRALVQVEPSWLSSSRRDLDDREHAVVVPRSLEKRVSFWQEVWGKIPDHVYVFADLRRPWIVHGRVDCRDLFDAAQKANASTGDGAKSVDPTNDCGERLTKTRRDISAKLKEDASSPTLVRRYGDRTLARTAYQSLIAIQGRQEALARALERASAHLGHVEALFEAARVPRLFARAAFIESLWQPDVSSRTGAVGAYQFMPTTGRAYLMVRGGVDERLDPLRSSFAAARYLRDMFKNLKEWPLAVTAYNTGPARLKKVLRLRKTADLGRAADAGDIEDFGFDGQNYYAQIAAVARLTADVRLAPLPLRARGFLLKDDMPFAKVSSCLHRSKQEVATSNPALTAPILLGATSIPKGYVIVVPEAGLRTASSSRGG